MLPAPCKTRALQGAPAWRSLSPGGPRLRVQAGTAAERGGDRRTPPGRGEGSQLWGENSSCDSPGEAVAGACSGAGVLLCTLLGPTACYHLLPSASLPALRCPGPLHVPTTWQGWHQPHGEPARTVQDSCSKTSHAGAAAGPRGLCHCRRQGVPAALASNCSHGRERLCVLGGKRDRTELELGALGLAGAAKPLAAG